MKYPKGNETDFRMESIYHQVNDVEEGTNLGNQLIQDKFLENQKTDADDRLSDSKLSSVDEDEIIENDDEDKSSNFFNKKLNENEDISQAREKSSSSENSDTNFEGSSSTSDYLDSQKVEFHDGHNSEEKIDDEIILETSMSNKTDEKENEDIFVNHGEGYNGDAPIRKATINDSLDKNDPYTFITTASKNIVAIGGRACESFGNETESVENQSKTSNSNSIGEMEMKLRRIIAPLRNHSKNIVNASESTDLKVSVITWNLAEKSPSENEASFLKRFRDNADADLILFGGQETENTKPRRTEGRRSRELRRLMIKMFGEGYVPLALHGLGGIQLGLFCKRSIVKEIEYVNIADVACGVGNVFHNKGAVSAYVQIKARNRKHESNSHRKKSVNLLFVACHLAAHVKNVDSRNADYWRIASEIEANILNLKKDIDGHLLPQFQSPEVGVKQISKKNGENIINFMDHVFFFGDLNYRIDLAREETEQKILEMKSITESKNMEASLKDLKLAKLRLDLLRHDQLLRTISEGRAFPDLAESEITFLPTFKYDKGSDSYDTSHKQRIPAWTDRILHKPFGVKVLEYNSVPSANHSDHRPVYGTYSINMRGRKQSSLKHKRSKKQRTRKTKNNVSYKTMKDESH